MSTVVPYDAKAHRKTVFKRIQKNSHQLELKKKYSDVFQESSIPKSRPFIVLEMPDTTEIEKYSHEYWTVKHQLDEGKWPQLELQEAPILKTFLIVLSFIATVLAIFLSLAIGIGLKNSLHGISGDLCFLLGVILNFVSMGTGVRLVSKSLDHNYKDSSKGIAFSKFAKELKDKDVYISSEFWTLYEKCQPQYRKLFVEKLKTYLQLHEEAIASELILTNEDNLKIIATLEALKEELIEISHRDNSVTPLRSSYQMHRKELSENNSIIGKVLDGKNIGVAPKTDDHGNPLPLLKDSGKEFNNYPHEERK